MTALATDPPVSEKQRRAMFAAREGRSTIGIPKKVGEEFVGKAKDMDPSDWKGLIRGLLKFFLEEEQEPAHAQDSLALDRNSVRTYDKDNRLHVAATNISKANVCPYLGREIPDYEELGLDPDKTYHLLRDPEELKKAAPSFNNLPVLSRHVPVSAEDHQPDKVVGSTGTDAEFEDPYLRNSLVVWAKDAIDGVEDETQKELSSAYRYRADMQPGTYKGVHYDGVMRDIVGNHVALVKAGRAGSDVVVGDSAPLNLSEKFAMTKTVAQSRKAAMVEGALIVHLHPKLAADAKLDLKPILSGVTSRNFKDKKAGIVTALKTATTGKLAADADLEDVTNLLDSLEKVEAGDDMEPNSALPVKAKDPNEGMDEEEPWEKVKATLKEKGVGEDTIEALDSIMKHGAHDEETEEEMEEKEERKEQTEDRKKARDADVVKKPAMDAALAEQRKRFLQDQKDLRVAEREVRPYVGDLAMDEEPETAADVYKAALVAMDVDLEGVPPQGYRALLRALPVPNQRREPVMATDAAGVKSFNDMYPSAARIARV